MNLLSIDTVFSSLLLLDLLSYDYTTFIYYIINVLFNMNIFLKTFKT